MSVSVLGVTSARGGSLVTTVAANLAGLLARSGNRTLLVSTDPVGGPQVDLGWDLGADGAIADARPLLDVVELGPEAARDLAALRRRRHDYDVVIVDVAADHSARAAVLAACDHVLITARPDAVSVAGTLGALDVSPAVLLGVVLVAAPERPRVIRSRARRALAEGLDGRAGVFASVVRAEVPAAWSARQQGRLVHELADAMDTAVLDPAATAAVLGLARDLAEVAQEVVLRLEQ